MSVSAFVSLSELYLALRSGQYPDEWIVACVDLGGFKLYGVGPSLSAVRARYPVKVGDDIEWTYHGQVGIHKMVLEEFERLERMEA